MITKKNLLNHELIGLNAEVMNTPIRGVIIDETKNTLLIRTKKGDKMVPKQKNEFKIRIGKETRIVKGDVILQRPYDRLKKKYKVKSKWGEI
jgi:ribonuclease P protein subunit POP4